MSRLWVFSPPAAGSSALTNDIYPNAAGGVVNLPWSGDTLFGGWETSSGSASAGYNFTNFDSLINAQLGYGAKKVVLVLGPVTFGGSNKSTPNYVFTPGWAASLSAPQLFCANGTAYYGTGAIPFGTAAQGVDNTAFPVVFQTPFSTAWRAAIHAALLHIAGASYASKVQYVRVGGACGGEWYPFAIEGLLTQVSPSNRTQLQSVWAAYCSAVQATIVAAGTSLKFVQALNGGSAAVSISYAWADQEASIAASNSLGLGCEGLQTGDVEAFNAHGYSSGGSAISGFPTADSAYLYKTYSTAPILQFQTLAASDPTGANTQMGSLVPLLPYAVSLGATDIELYYADWQVAYDPTSPLNGYSAAYQAAFLAAAGSAGGGTGGGGGGGGAGGGGSGGTGSANWIDSIVNAQLPIVLPTDLDYGADGGPEQNTAVTTAGSGHVTTDANWLEPGMSWSLQKQMQETPAFQNLLAFFLYTMGRALGFWFRDWHDYQSAPLQNGAGTEFVATSLGPNPGSAGNWAASTTFQVGTQITDSSGNVQEVAGWLFAAIADVQVVGSALDLTLSNSNDTRNAAAAGSTAILLGLTTATFLNNDNLLVTGGIVGVGIALSIAHSAYGPAADTGSVFINQSCAPASSGPTSGLSGATQPTWTGGAGSYTIDNGLVWVQKAKFRGPPRWIHPGPPPPVGSPNVYQIIKTYNDGVLSVTRNIAGFNMLPDDTPLTIYVNAALVPSSQWAFFDPRGRIYFLNGFEPPLGAVITSNFSFTIPVRWDDDWFQGRIDEFDMYALPAMRIVELNIWR